MARHFALAWLYIQPMPSSCRFSSKNVLQFLASSFENDETKQPKCAQQSKCHSNYHVNNCNWLIYCAAVHRCQHFRAAVIVVIWQWLIGQIIKRVQFAQLARQTDMEMSTDMCAGPKSISLWFDFYCCCRSFQLWWLLGCNLIRVLLYPSIGAISDSIGNFQLFPRLRRLPKQTAHSLRDESDRMQTNDSSSAAFWWATRIFHKWPQNGKKFKFTPIGTATTIPLRFRIVSHTMSSSFMIFINADNVQLNGTNALFHCRWTSAVNSIVIQLQIWS